VPEGDDLTNRHYAVVVDAQRARVLAVRRNGGWALATWESRGRVRWNDAGPVNDAARSLLGLEAVTLRPLLARREGTKGTWAHELEPRDANWEPAAGARWEEPASFPNPAELELVERAFAFTDDRPAWARAAWYDDVDTWIDSRLEELGRSRSGAARQLHAWAISSVLRVPTDAGDVYFKAVPPLFGHEPTLTAALGRRHRGRVTCTLARDEERRWLLMDDLGGTPLAEVSDCAAWEEALRSYAELQLAWVGDEERLLGLGCRDRRLDALAADIEPTLAEPLLTELPGALSADELRELPALSARLAEAVERLRALEIPPTLEHGDLHPGNVRVRPGGPVFHDWTDGCLSVPLFSLAPFLENNPFGGHRLRDAYLEPWSALLSVDRVQEACELAEELGRFHVAVSYRWIAHAAGPHQRWELGMVFPQLIRALLRSPDLP